MTNVSVVQVPASGVPKWGMETAEHRENRQKWEKRTCWGGTDGACSAYGTVADDVSVKPPQADDFDVGD